MKGIADTIYTFRFLKLFSTKWENTEAYKMGIIDDEGTPLKKLNTLTPAEKNVYTAFIRLVFKFKKMMGKLPGGKSALARYGAAVLLIKEHTEEVERMGMNLKSLEEGFKKYINEDKRQTFKLKSGKNSEKVISKLVGMGLDVAEGKDKDSIIVTGDKSDMTRASRMMKEEVTNSTGGIEGKDQPLGKKGELKNKKKKKEGSDSGGKKDEVVDKGKGKSDKNEEVKYSYQMIGNSLIRVDEIKRVVKKRVRGQKRQKKREYVPTKRRTRTGKKKLRGGQKAKWKRSHKKAYRKAHTGSAAHKRKRSMKKSRKYNKK